MITPASGTRVWLAVGRVRRGRDEPAAQYGSSPDSPLEEAVDLVERQPELLAHHLTAGVGGAPTTSALRIRDLFVGAGDLDTVGFAGLWADLRRPLPRSVLRCDLIHADMAAELVLVSSGMTIPLSHAIFSANDICAGLAGLGPSSLRGSPSAFLRAC